MAHKNREELKQEKRDLERRKTGEGRSLSIGFSPGPVGGQAGIGSFQEYRTPTEDAATEELGEAAREFGQMAQEISTQVRETGPVVRQTLRSIDALAQALRAKLGL